MQNNPLLQNLLYAPFLPRTVHTFNWCIWTHRTYFTETPINMDIRTQDTLTQGHQDQVMLGHIGTKGSKYIYGSKSWHRQMERKKKINEIVQPLGTFRWFGWFVTVFATRPCELVESHVLHHPCVYFNCPITSINPIPTLLDFSYKTYKLKKKYIYIYILRSFWTLSPGQLLTKTTMDGNQVKG